MRTLLLTGPGGAGTTTLAAAAAVRSARAGRRTLLLSRQAVAGARAGRRRRLSTSSASIRRRRSSGCGASAAGRRRRRRPAADPAAGELGGAAARAPPTLALFAELARADADLVVARRRPAGGVAALVALPAALRWWLDQLMPPGMRALGAVRTAAVASGAAQARTGRRGARRRAGGRGPARPRPADRRRRPSCLVAEPRRASPSRRCAPAVTTLALHGLRAGARARPGAAADGAGEWAAQRAAEQDAVARRARRGRAGAPGPRARRRARRTSTTLAGLLEGFRLPEAADAPGRAAAERHEGAWQLTVPLPFAERGRLST